MRVDLELEVETLDQTTRPNVPETHKSIHRASRHILAIRTHGASQSLPASAGSMKRSFHHVTTQRIIMDLFTERDISKHIIYKYIIIQTIRRDESS